MNAIINYVEKYADNLFVIQIWLLIIILATLAWVWFYNRKKYNHLKHQIPASVVKSYLDSIIQNSTALKSSLFRGGGLDVDPSSVPSVMPLTDLPGGTAVNLDSLDGDEALKAQVAKLQSQLSDQKNITSELEANNASLEGVIKEKQERIIELEGMLENSGGDSIDPELANNLKAVTAERDELAETLKQFDIISGDLADLKRYKQENEQLKKALEEQGKSVAVEEIEVTQETPIVEPITESEAESHSANLSDEAAPFAEDAAEPEVEEVQAAAPEPEEAEEEEESSPEDLLSEFEKMLK